MSTLLECLSAETIDQLKNRLQPLPYKGSKGLKKQALVDLITQLITSQLRSLWDCLDDVSQKVVAEVIYSADGTFNTAQFFAKYGTKAHRDPAMLGKNYALLKTLFFNNYMPVDLQEKFKYFVKKPAQQTLSGVKEVTTHPNMVIISTQFAALQELKALLRLIDTQSLKISEKTQQPSAAALLQVEKILCGGDFYSAENQKQAADYEQEVGLIRPYAWLMLVQAGKLARVSGGKLCLTPKGKKAINACPEDIIKSLWEAWLNSKILDEFRRINAIKGQTGKKGKRCFSDVVSRRYVIEEALTQAPVDEWLSFDQMSRYMLANNLTFEVTDYEPWHLYICEPEYGSLGYGGSHNWNILQERYMLCFLFEYAATLGLIDVAYISPKNARAEFRHMWGTDDLSFLSRYDGLQYIRLNHLGEYCLNLTAEYKPQQRPVDTLDMTINHDGDIHIHTTAIPPEVTMVLNQFAKQKTRTHWILDKQTLLASVLSGYALSDLNQLFLQHQVDVPANIASLVKQLEYNSKQILKKETTVLFECNCAELAHYFLSQAATKKYCMLVGERYLIVPENQLLKFQQAMKKLDYPVIL